MIAFKDGTAVVKTNKHRYKRFVTSIDEEDIKQLKSYYRIDNNPILMSTIINDMLEIIRLVGNKHPAIAIEKLKEVTEQRIKVA